MKCKKMVMFFMAVLFVLSLTGCAENKSTSQSSTSSHVEKTYDGHTKVRTSTGSYWTPPKGSQKLPDGTIADSEGCVIGNDGTVHYNPDSVG